MTSEEKRKDAANKIADLIKWFDGRELPKPPIKLVQGSTIEDVKKFVDLQIARLGIGEIYNKVLQHAYTDLLKLKTIIENGDAGTTNGNSFDPLPHEKTVIKSAKQPADKVGSRAKIGGKRKDFIPNEKGI